MYLQWRNGVSSCLWTKAGGKVDCQGHQVVSFCTLPLWSTDKAAPSHALRKLFFVITHVPVLLMVREVSSFSARLILASSSILRAFLDSFIPHKNPARREYNPTLQSEVWYAQGQTASGRQHQISIILPHPFIMQPPNTQPSSSQPIHPPTYPPPHLSAHPPIHPPTHLSIPMFTHPPNHSPSGHPLPTHLPTHLFITHLCTNPSSPSPVMSQ